ncbi:MAG: ferritin family protein [Candidatus Omnitrophota bacterium]
MKISEKDGVLEITEFDAREAYTIACRIEKDGILFYKGIADKQTDEAAKKTLEFLISEEKKHLKFFEGCLDEIGKEKEDVNEDDDLLSSLDYGIFQPYQSMADLDQILKDIKKALKLGIIIEDKTIKFYALCTQNVTCEQTKTTLRDIIGEEEKHKALLSEIMGK